ncbi:MAG: YicC family protein [Treponema sp.]|nr:YicC family protein [Treponema sp.]
MISMTGYSYREKAGQDLSLSVEIKGYNSRFLDIFVNIPPWLSALETKIRDKICSCCGRGKVEVFVRIREHNAPVNISVNTNAAKAYSSAIDNLARELGLSEKPSLSVLLEMEGVLNVEKNRDDERYWQEIEPLLNEAVQAFTLEREREGKHTANDIFANLEKIESSVKTVAAFAPAVEKAIKENIKTRFAELLGDQVDENRILAETAALLVKHTVSEEISRLSSHLEEFRAETGRNPRPGKKLDFLCQEINREINTIGSKSAIIEMSGEVVQMKEALENIREQLRNVE